MLGPWPVLSHAGSPEIIGVGTSACRGSLAFPDRTGFSSTASTVTSRSTCHVRRENAEARFWLQSVALASNRGFSPRELNEIRRIIVGKESTIIEAWHEHCGQRGS